EHVAGAGDEQPTERVVVVEQRQRVPDREVHRTGHRVAAVGPVDRAAGERTVALEAHERRPEPVSFRRPAQLWVVHGVVSSSSSRSTYVTAPEIFRSMISSSSKPTCRRTS